MLRRPTGSAPLAERNSDSEGRRKWMAQLRKGTLEFCILGVIRDRARYGFEIAQLLHEAGLETTEGTLYPLLNRLLADELIASHWQASASGPPRKYYAMTDAGRQALGWMQASWESYTRAVDNLISSAGPPTVPTPEGQRLDVRPVPPGETQS